MGACVGPSLLGLLLISSSVCLAARGRYAQQLFRDLFVNYTSALRPVENTDNAINVTLQVTLSQIIDMDERNQILTLYLWVRQVWMDSFLTWSKDDYDGLDSIQIPSRYVWKPDIVLYNSADDEFSSSMETNVALRSDGQVTWDQPSITKSSCSVDVAFFPFDLQECILTFGSWTHNGNQMDLNIQLDTADLADLVPNVEWQVLGMPAKKNVILYGCCSDPYPDITFTLQLKRRASFYIFNLLLPCMMISFLAPLGFYLPAESGEKVSLGVTVLLALTVFQLLVAESMPPSESVPLIGKYYIATMTMVTASTALTIFIMNLHHCGPEARPVPDWAKVLVLKYLNRICLVFELGETCTREGPEEGQAAGGAHSWALDDAAGFPSADQLSLMVHSPETSKLIGARRAETRTRGAVSKLPNLHEVPHEAIGDREKAQRLNSIPRVCHEENGLQPAGFKERHENPKNAEQKERKQNGGQAGEVDKMAAEKTERKRDDVRGGEEQVRDERTAERGGGGEEPHNGWGVFEEVKAKSGRGEFADARSGPEDVRLILNVETGKCRTMSCACCCCRHLSLHGDAPWGRLHGDMAWGGLRDDVASIAASFQEQKDAQALIGDWRKVAKVLDRALMWIFFIMVFIMSVLILGKSI